VFALGLVRITFTSKAKETVIGKQRSKGGLIALSLNIKIGQMVFYSIALKWSSLLKCE